jgi:hypothetical protein
MYWIRQVLHGLNSRMLILGDDGDTGINSSWDWIKTYNPYSRDLFVFLYLQKG